MSAYEWFWIGAGSAIVFDGCARRFVAWLHGRAEWHRREIERLDREDLQS